MPKTNGYTVIEVLVVLSIIAILAVMLTVVVGGGYLGYKYLTADQTEQVEQADPPALVEEK